MEVRVSRLVLAATAALWLAGCESTSQVSDTYASTGQPLKSETTGTVAGAPPPGAPGSVSAALMGSDPNDDLSLGKRQYAEQNYGLAEKHFRRAVEKQPRTAEAWVGLAASYDRLRRFDLADRAYDQAISILGPTPEILNNRGYSYMMRGDYKAARKQLLAAQIKDPESKRIRANLELLEEVVRNGKGMN